MKMNFDKDKFENDSKTYKELHEDAINNFNTNINKYIAEYEKIKNDLIRVEKSKDLQIQNLEKLNKQLTEENFEIKQEMQILKNTSKNKKKIFDENEQNLAKIKYQFNKLKEENDMNETENKKIKDDKEQIIIDYEIKIKKLKEEYENKIYYWEDINDKQNKKINIIEQKAMEMVKAQQVISEKLKRELNNAINYYEGIIANLQGGNK